jgi:hypothetical protein
MCEQREQISPVLGQPAVPCFHVTELALDAPEGMFALGAKYAD